MAKSSISTWRFAGYTLAATVAMGGAIFAYQQVDQFLIRDPRFVLQSTEDDDDTSVRVAGVHHASRERIHAAFRSDAGKSVYLFPLAERRRRLLGVEWVKDATVSRIWPNQVAVEIVERKPVAFVRFAKEHPSASLHLIDEDGVLLPLTGSAKFKLPVVTGVKRDEQEADRKARIRRMLRLQGEVGAHMDRISEVDLGDPDNLKITYPMGNRAMILSLGRGHYALRLKKFLENYDEVKKRIPEARALDLRMEDRITAVKDDGVSDGEKHAQ